MPAKSNLWSKLFSRFAPSPTKPIGEYPLAGLFDLLTASPVEELPEQALAWTVSSLKARAGWLYIFKPGDANSQHILAQAGERANDETERRASSALARKFFDGKSAAPDNARLVVALGYQGNTLGAIVFLWDTKPPQLPEKLGSYFGFALAYTGLHEEARQEAEQRRQLEARLAHACADECKQETELALLNGITDAIVSGAGPMAVLEILCRELVSTFGATQSGAALLDENGQSLRVVAEYIPAHGTPSLGVTIPVNNNPSSLYVIRMKAPLAVSDVQHDIRMTPIYELMKQRGVASILILPLLVGNQVIGTVGIDSAEPREYSEAEIQLALKAATLAAWAVNAQTKE
ncbi:MAG: GAF domain-containing protein [Chloroflexota bacterium]